MVVNKIEKAIEDSKRKKQFRLRAKDRSERKDKRVKGQYSNRNTGIFYNLLRDC
jgi:hypothetical protein